MSLTLRPGIRPQEKVRNAFRIGHPVRARKASAEPAPPDARTSHGRVLTLGVPPASKRFDDGRSGLGDCLWLHKKQSNERSRRVDLPVAGEAVLVPVVYRRLPWPRCLPWPCCP